MYSSRSVPGSWKSPSPSLMKPRFSSRRRAASSALSSGRRRPRRLASCWRKRAIDAGSTMIGASDGRRGRRRLHADRRQILGLGVDGRRLVVLRGARCARPPRPRRRSPPSRRAPDRRPSRTTLRASPTRTPSLSCAAIGSGIASSSTAVAPARRLVGLGRRRTRPPGRGESGSTRARSSASTSSSSLSGSRRLRRSSRSSFSGNAARATRQDAPAPATMPRAAWRPAHASTTATSRVLTSVIISSATTIVVVAASAAPTLPMKPAASPPSHSPSMPPGPCDEKPLSANGRCSSTATEPSSSSVPPASRTPSTRRRAAEAAHRRRPASRRRSGTTRHPRARRARTRSPRRRAPSCGSPPTCRDISDRPANRPPASSRMPLISRRRWWRPVPRFGSDGASWRACWSSVSEVGLHLHQTT